MRNIQQSPPPEVVLKIKRENRIAPEGAMRIWCVASSLRYFSRYTRGKFLGFSTSDSENKHFDFHIVAQIVREGRMVLAILAQTLLIQ